MTITKAVLPALPPRPANVPAPARIKIAIPVPQVPDQASRTNITYDPADTIHMPPPFNMKLEWAGFLIGFSEEEGDIYPYFEGDLAPVPGRVTHPQQIPAGWTIEQAEAAFGWAYACLCHLTLVAAAAAVEPLTSYAQAAGVSVWHEPVAPSLSD